MISISVRKILLIFIGLTVFSILPSQIKKANRFFDKMAYPDAIKAYEKALSDGETNFIRTRLGDCYTAIDNKQAAMQWYRKAAESGSANPETILNYAGLLKSRARYKEAKFWYEQFGMVTGDFEKSSALAFSCDESEKVRGTPDRYVITRLGISSGFGEFSAVPYRKGLAYSSSRPRGFLIKWLSGVDGKPFYDLYYSERSEGGEFLEARLIPGSINSRFHDGPVVFTKSQDIAFVTRNRHRQDAGKSDSLGKNTLAIYWGRQENGKWGKFELLPLCNESFTAAHPALSSDEKTIFFSSNMPGGIGGHDIWFSRYESGNWQKPENAGESINTSGDELFPAIDAAGILYFSSDGHAGFGGLDIFSAKKNGNEWQEVENLGFALNTEADEFGLYADFTTGEGYFTSDRDGGAGGDDIYFFKLSSSVEFQIVDIRTGLAIPGAKLSFTTASGSTSVQLSGDGGIVKFPVKAGKDYFLVAEAEGYKTYKEKIAVTNLAPNEILPVAVEMELAPEFSLEIRTWDRKDGWPLENVPVRIISDGDQVFFTNSEGWVSIPMKPESNYTVIIQHKDFRPVVEKVGTGPASNASPVEMEIVLDQRPHVMIEGLVSNEAGEFLPGAEIVVSTFSGFPIAKTETQIDGVFWLVVDSIEEFNITASSAAYSQQQKQFRANFNSSDALSARFVLKRLTELTAIPQNDQKEISPTVVQSDDSELIEEEEGEEFEESDTQAVANANEIIVPEQEIALPEKEIAVPAKKEIAPPALASIPAPSSRKDLTLYYDNNSTLIRPVYINDLTALLEVLKSNPASKVRIEGFSDTKGTPSVNLQLSDSRAKTIAWFFKARGIDKSRIEMQAFGEAKLVNDCIGNSDCPDWKHQENRRAVVKLLGSGPPSQVPEGRSLSGVEGSRGAVPEKLASIGLPIPSEKEVPEIRQSNSGTVIKDVQVSQPVLKQGNWNAVRTEE